MRIVIETLPHAQHRYDTIGDYWEDPDGTLQVRVSTLGDERYEILVAVHEVVEYFLCRERGIKEPDIMAWDKAVPASSPFADDPGHDPAAPYHHEHVFAERLERMFAFELGVNWQEYERACERLYK